jgi:hypothetical protein
VRFGALDLSILASDTAAESISRVRIRNQKIEHERQRSGSHLPLEEKRHILPQQTENFSDSPLSAVRRETLLQIQNQPLRWGENRTATISQACFFEYQISLCVVKVTGGKGGSVNRVGRSCRECSFEIRIA